jgi:flagellin
VVRAPDRAADLARADAQVRERLILPAGAESAVADERAQRASDALGLTVVTAAGSGSANFQVSARAGDQMTVAFAQTDVASLGFGAALTAFSTAGNTTHTGQVTAATNLTTALDTAIQTLSTTRANLGARQNRLEHAINNIAVSSENTTAAESRIRDADMAKEMAAFSRNQILNQAGTAILAQANQVPQGVLSLLR